MNKYFQLLQSSLLELALSPSLPILIATCIGISTASFAVSLLWSLRKAPLKRAKSFDRATLPI